jgi:RNA polymerase nonessential primary-like sigma factor
MPGQAIPEAVRYLAARYKSRCALDASVLLEAGMLGYQRALDEFDPARGVDFANYAYWWVKQAITKAIVDHESPLAGV